MALLNSKKLLKLQKSSSSNSLASSQATSFTSHDIFRTSIEFNKSDNFKLERKRQLDASFHLNDLLSNRNKTFDNFQSKNDLPDQKISDFVADFMSYKTKMLTSKVFLKRKINPNRSAVTIRTIILILIGIMLGFSSATWLRSRLLNCNSGRSCCSNMQLSGDELVEPNMNKNKQHFMSQQTENIKIYTEVEPEKSLVFVGVMTAQKYLDTRAKSVYNTWGRDIPGKMSFFSRSGSSTQLDLPLVSLPDVDDSYPPQKKSFMMLKFMHDNYLNKFEWFMRVDDDVYIKPNKLELLLRSLNSSVPQFIGQAGLGNKDEFGLLSLDYDENFCMGGPGMVFSRETLKRVVPHISYCLKNLYSTHEDVEIGRCVRKFANISCTWSYEMQNIFHHNSSGNNAFTGDLLSREVIRATSLHPIKKSEYQYRLHNFLNQRKIIDLRQKCLQLEREVYRLRHDLTYGNQSQANKEDNMYDSVSSIADRFKLPPRLNAIRMDMNRRENRYDFDFFTRSLFSSSYISPKRGLEGYWRISLMDSVRQIMDEINRNSIERGRLIDFKDILYGYVRHHPLIGIDYIIDVLLVYRKYEGRKMTVPVRRHAYVRNSFTTLQFREDNLDSSLFVEVPLEYRANVSENSAQQEISATDKKNNNDGGIVKNILSFFLPKLTNENENKQMNKRSLTQLNSYPFQVKYSITSKTINFIMPLTGRWEIFLRFMNNYEKISLVNDQKEKTKLTIVLFEDSKTADGPKQNPNQILKQSDLILALFSNLTKKHSLYSDSLSLIVLNQKFSRSIGCETGAAKHSDHDLLFFVDVDIAFTKEFLLRARLNTVENKQVYYPIVFSEYDPDDPIDALKNENSNKNHVRKNHFDFNRNNGYWRQFGFGILVTYYSDLKRVGGFDKSIVGWGKEDVDLYEKFIKSNLIIFRTVDPGLTHVFHKIECDVSLSPEQMIMCLGSKATSIASQEVLSELCIKMKADIIEPPLLNLSLVNKKN